MWQDMKPTACPWVSYQLTLRDPPSNTGRHSQTQNRAQTPATGPATKEVHIPPGGDGGDAWSWDVEASIALVDILVEEYKVEEDYARSELKCHTRMSKR